MCALPTCAKEITQTTRTANTIKVFVKFILEYDVRNDVRVLRYKELVPYNLLILTTLARLLLKTEL